MDNTPPRRSLSTTVHSILFPFLDQGARGRDLTHIQVVLTLYAGLGLVVVACLAGRDRWADAVMSGLGVLAAGTVVGFLFGVPKVRQAGAPRRGPGKDSASDRATDPARTGSKLLDDPTGPSYQQSVNTNLEDVSDWLTKILIGVGLVEAKSIADTVGPELNRAAGKLEDTGRRNGRRRGGVLLLGDGVLLRLPDHPAIFRPDVPAGRLGGSRALGGQVELVASTRHRRSAR